MPNSIRTSSELKWKAVGLVGFFGPGAALVAHNVLGWAWRPSWLAGVTVSTTSLAVVYAVMLELGFNQTTCGKAILTACFVNDLGTVLALGLIFSPFTKKTLRLPAISLVSLLIFAFRDAPVLRTSRGRASELEVKYLLFRLFGPGSIAVGFGNEAVLPAYIIGMVLAGCAGKIIF